MADRRVTHTGKDRYGNITSLGKPGELWSPRLKADAIRDIELRLHTYYVQWTDMRTEVEVVNSLNGKYLKTDRDGTTRNNLDDLPDL